MAGYGRGSPLASSAKVVLQTHDVVFTEIIAALHFDEDEQFVARILDAMRRTDGDVDSLARLYFDVAIIERDLRSALDNDPMLGALGVLLVAETLAGQHFNPFDFEIVTFIKHRETSPGALIEFR